MVNLVSHPQVDMWYTLLLRLKKVFTKGGPNRQKYTYPTLIFQLFKLSAAYET